MRLDELQTAETVKKRRDLKAFTFDINVMFAAASLMIILLYSSNLVFPVLGAIEPFIDKIIAAVARCSEKEASDMFVRFITSELFLNTLDIFYYSLSILLPFLFIRRFTVNKPASYFPVKAKMPEKSISFVVLSMGLCYSVNLVCNLLFSKLYPVVEEPGGGVVTALATFLSAVIIAPFGEELLFRGAVFQTFAKYDKGFAVFASALIFALAHRNPPSVINAFVLGLCIAVAFAKTGSITLCVLMHLANNAFATFASYISGSVTGILFYIIIIIGIISAICFAVATLIRFLATRSSRHFSYDDTVSVFPRVNAGDKAKSLTKSFFFWFYLVLVAACIVLMYIW